jgi:ribonuclease E
MPVAAPADERAEAGSSTEQQAGAQSPVAPDSAESPEAGAAAEGGEREGGRRRGRSRDRFRRERRPDEAGAEGLSADAAGESPEGLAPAAAQAAEQVETQPAPTPTRFELPIDELQRIAETAGLQWVNSDPEKIASVQAAIAAEPAPVHVPRERKPLVVVDEGPLILVETRKDLSQVQLPFERQQPGA